ncbi:MAG: DUF4270 family protein, partial [Saprospiraceae bacterium]
MSGKTITNICWVWVVVLGMMTGCQDPLTVGSELLESERLNLEVISDLKLNSQTIAGTTVLTHRPEVDSRTYLLGQLNDNLFGKVNAELYMKFQMISAIKANYHLESSLKFDSLVLVLQYDSTATYANSSAAQQIDIFQLTAPYLSSGTYYSDTKLDIGSSPIASTTTTIRPQDSVSYVDHVTRTLVTKAPQLRIRLNDAFGKDLIGNEEAAKSDTS